jgi:hypothetical protein
LAEESSARRNDYIRFDINKLQVIDMIYDVFNRKWNYKGKIEELPDYIKERDIVTPWSEMVNKFKEGTEDEKNSYLKVM